MVREDNVTSTSLGLLSYRDPESDRCYYWSRNVTIADSFAIEDNRFGITGLRTSSVVTRFEQLSYYLDEVLGNDWYVAMIFLTTACAISAAAWLYATSYFCSTQFRPFRLFVGAIVGVFLPLFEALGTIFIHTSEWCAIEGCTMGRSTWFSIASTGCFLVAGICFCTMENWPGPQGGDETEKDLWADEKKHKQRRRSSRSRRTSKSRLGSGQRKRNSQRPSRGSKRRSSKDAWIIDVEKSNGETSRELEEGTSDEYSQNRPPYDLSSDREDPPPPPSRRASGSARSSRSAKQSPKSSPGSHRKSLKGNSGHQKQRNSTKNRKSFEFPAPPPGTNIDITHTTVPSDHEESGHLRSIMPAPQY